MFLSFVFSFSMGWSPGAEASGHTWSACSAPTQQRRMFWCFTARTTAGREGSSLQPAETGHLSLTHVIIFRQIFYWDLNQKYGDTFFSSHQVHTTATVPVPVVLGCRKYHKGWQYPRWGPREFVTPLFVVVPSFLISHASKYLFLCGELLHSSEQGNTTVTNGSHWYACATSAVWTCLKLIGLNISSRWQNSVPSHPPTLCTMRWFCLELHCLKVYRPPTSLLVMHTEQHFHLNITSLYIPTLLMTRKLFVFKTSSDIQQEHNFWDYGDLVEFLKTEVSQCNLCKQDWTSFTERWLHQVKCYTNACLARI